MKKLPITGISRNQSKLSSKDGDCDELINLRVKDGEWRLMTHKSELIDFSDTLLAPFTNWYKHPETNDDWFIAYGPHNNSIQTVDVSIPPTDFSSTTILRLNSTESLLKITHYGKILLIITSERVYYLRYTKINISWSYSLLPEIIHPAYTFCSDKITGAETEGQVVFGRYEGGGEGWANAMALLINDVHEKNKEGYFNGATLFQVALRTHTGDFIEYSAPFYYFIGQHDLNKDQNAIRFTRSGTGSPGDGMYDYWHGYLNQVRFMFKDAQAFKDVLDEYDGIIKSLCVFMSNPQESINMGYDANWGAYDVDRVAALPSPYTNNILKENVEMRLVSEVKIGDIPLTNEYVDVLKPNLRKYESFESLPVNDFTNHSVFSDIVFEYNSRLHFGSPRTVFAKNINQPLPDFIQVTHERSQAFGVLDSSFPTYDRQSVNDKVLQYYFIDTNKDRYCQSISETATVPVWKNSSGEDVLVYNNLLSYPDNRATGVRLYYYQSSTDKYFLSYNRAQKPSIFRNLSVAEQGQTLASHILGGLFIYPLRQIAFNTTGGVYPGTQISYSTIDTLPNFTIDTNRIQVSALNSFLYYPAENSYRVGSQTNDVVGLSVQTIALSEGQFGEYPLNVFTSSGIYLLRQGSGNILYSNVTPLNMEISNNPDNITAINSGVVYSSDSGLKLLLGTNIIELSKVLEGNPDTSINSDATYIAAINGADDVVDLDDSISVVNFTDYLASSLVAYDRINNEIFVSNPNYNYSYIFCVEYKVWSKSSQSFSEFINYNPEGYCFKSGKLYNFSQEEEGSSASLGVLLRTRPFNLGTLNLKSITRIAARYLGTTYEVNPSEPDPDPSGDLGQGILGDSATPTNKQLAFYLYGSLNGSDWKLINGKRITSWVAFKREILLRNTRTTARYFIVVLSTEAYECTLAPFELSDQDRNSGKIR